MLISEFKNMHQELDNGKLQGKLYFIVLQVVPETFENSEIFVIHLLEK